ncbi:MAG: hypothetical protein AAF567_13930 [Actinomycetota bacterium]
MSPDYLELLDPEALGILAETTGVAQRADAGRVFAERPNEIRVALASAEALALLNDPTPDHGRSRRLLQTAIAVHRTAEEICTAGWTARSEAPVDMALLRFAGQFPFQTFMVDLIAGHLPADFGIPGFEVEVTRAGTPERLNELLDLCDAVDEVERGGALRLLGDEALFTVSLFPGRAAATPVTPEMLVRVEAVLPKAVRSVLEELTPQIQSQLDLYLHFGPIWYRMASQNLLHRSMRSTLSDLAREFSVARRFLVRVAQGPLAPLRERIFEPVPC